MDELLQAHSDAIDSIVSEFTNKLDLLVARATKSLNKDLLQDLKIDGGLVAQTARNQKILGGLDGRFQQALDEAGYQDLVDSFISTFNGQFEWFNKVLADISGDLTYPLPAVVFSKADLVDFDLQQANAKTIIKSAVEAAATRVKLQAVQSVGGLPIKALAFQISETLGTSVAQSQNLAETTISTFYRSITDKGYQLIEADLPLFKIRYNYEGPLDKLTRPFCTKLERQTRSGKTWTRAEIDKMNNGQIPNVFTTCGGYRCRHQWVISRKDLNQQQKTKGPETSAPSKRKPTLEAAAREVSSRRALHNVRMEGRLKVPASSEQIARLRTEAEAVIKARRANV